MLDGLLREWNHGLLAGSEEACAGVEEALRRRCAEDPGDHRAATLLASLLLRTASAMAEGEWAVNGGGWGDDPDGDDDGDDDGDAGDDRPWAGIARRRAEAGALLEVATRAAPADPATALTRAVHWLDRWDLHSCAASTRSGDAELARA